MHKSIIILLGLLVFLLPFGPSSMNISNAMAITEAEYYTDHYMGYANDMVNEYEDESSYANNDGYKPDRSSYGNNNYDREYPSYKQESNSYGYDDKHKSKDRDSSNSVSISKIKCENVNNNFNNVVIENLNIGNSGNGGSTSDDGSNGDQSANAYGNNGERYNDGYQKEKGITCQINNNNSIIAAGNATDGNATDGEGDLCEECFESLTPLQLEVITEGIIGASQTVEALCNFLLAANVIDEEELRADIGIAGVDPTPLIICLENAGVVIEEL